MKRILWQHTSLKILFLFSIVFFTTNTFAEYDRNKAVPVEKVLFGSVISVRNITQEELIKDKNNGWRTFGGALMGGIIGNQFGGGSGRDVATILGAIIGGLGLCVCTWAPILSFLGIISILASFLSDNKSFFLTLGIIFLLISIIVPKKHTCTIHAKNLKTTKKK